MKNLKYYFVIIIFFLFQSSHTFGDKIYKWIDEKGAVHFSNRPPEELKNMKNHIQERDVTKSSPLLGKRGSKPKIPKRNPVEYATSCTFTLKGLKKFGTGFFVSSNGYAITCKHVIDGEGDFLARLNDQNEYPVNIISTSDKYDLALLLVVTHQKTPWLPMKDMGISVPGRRIYAIGTSAGLQATVTDGVLTGLREMDEIDEKVIQFSAPINPGNSGGPLIDEEGKVLGVVSWKYITHKGIPVSGVGFAIPTSYLISEYSSYFE